MIRKRIIASRVSPRQWPEPLDRYLAGRFTYLTQEQWRQEVTDGRISLNGVTAADPSTALAGGEMLAWDGSSVVEPDIDHRITILYEDEWFVAVNKTGNLPVHPSGPYFNNTLVALLEERYGQKVYPAHRIDRETSGAILLAFNGKSAGDLSRALAQGSKEYLALVHGCFADHETIIDLPLGRDPESAVNKKRKAWPGGTEKSLTRFQKVLTAGDISLVRCFPETGRLHQIRAHLNAAGFPIVGDKLYGREANAFLEFIRNGFTTGLQERLLLPRSALHAARLVIFHPHTRKKMIIRAPLPEMFADFIRTKRAQSGPAKICPG